MKKAIYKVPNGKLLKIFLAEQEGLIASLKITGDFFLYPEENIEKLEEFFIGTRLEKEALMARLNEFFTTYPTTFFGLDAESLISTILTAS